MAERQQEVRKVSRRARKLLADLDSLPKLIDDFSAASGVSKSRLSVLFYGHHNFQHLLSHGRDFRISTVRKALTVIAAGEGLASLRARMGTKT